MKRRRFRKGGGHSVYVVLLSPSVKSLATVQRLNPKAEPAKPCLYVGMTGLTPEERFETHKRGHKASRWVKNYGIRLLPRMYAHLNPMSYDEAVKMEAFIAVAWRKQGYTVLGGH